MKKNPIRDSLLLAKEELRHKRIVAVVYLLLRFSVILVMIAQFFNRNFENVFLCLLTLILFLLPTVLEHTPLPMDSTIEELIHKLSEKYEYIIIDAASVGQISVTLSLNRVANSVLFVVGHDSATIPEIQSSLEKLDKSGIRVIGCVVNGVQRGKSSNRHNDVHHDKPRKQKAAAKAESFTPPQAQPDLLDELKKPVQPESAAADMPVQAAPARNIMDDLMTQSSGSKATRSDDDVMSALLDMSSNDTNASI